jgi:hypothetical protein
MLAIFSAGPGRPSSARHFARFREENRCLVREIMQKEEARKKARENFKCRFSKITQERHVRLPRKMAQNDGRRIGKLRRANKREKSTRTARDIQKTCFSPIHSQEKHDESSA